MSGLDKISSMRFPKPDSIDSSSTTNPAFALRKNGHALTLSLMITGTAMCMASAIEMAKFS